MDKKNSAEKIHKMRHSAEHVLTQAMRNLGYKFFMAMGPAIEDGFYFDFELVEGEISELDFAKIEKEMKKIIKLNLPITQEFVSVEKARELFKDNSYKQEWIDEAVEKGEKLSIYWTGEPNSDKAFVDLCIGPHVESTSEVGEVKLLSIAGAYWRGSEKNKMLTRIYGTAFETKKEVDDYVELLEEAKKRDHRKIGKDMDLFVFSDVVGKGLPLWTERGATLRRELERFIVDEEIKRGYKHVYTPDIARLDLYVKSGHYPYYKDSMYAPIKGDEDDFMLRPMTCPHHFELYLSKPHSYKELPMRIAELAKLYRYERSGELSGLMRVRGFCLADAHIICAEESQAKNEINLALDLIEFISETFGLKMGIDYSYRLSLGDRMDDKKYFKNDSAWDYAETMLRDILLERKSEFVEAEHEAAFYGPKIDIQMRNVLGKEDTAFTVQYDFVMPQRFDLCYTNDKGDVVPCKVVVHRSSIGAIERVVAYIIEHFSGNFPVWLHPEQVCIIPIGRDQLGYANVVKTNLAERVPNARVIIDESDETLQKKIRNAQLMKIPYMIVIGKREEENKTISVRLRTGKSLPEMSVDKFSELLEEIIKTKSLELE